MSRGEKCAIEIRWKSPLICCGLALLVFAIYGKAASYDFVNYDDDRYVYENGVVTAGLNLHGVEWAFNHVVAGNWHPLTMILYMVEAQAFGQWPGGYHMVNVFLHAANAVLLFLLLAQMTAARWRSAFVAALFACHPLRVESVAWVSELKDDLSGVFFMLMLIAYRRHATGGKSMAPVAIWLALGLMSKPMLVTAPFVLLLLDYWPFRRLCNGPEIWRSIMEKIPLFGLSVVSCVITVLAQRAAIQPAAQVSLGLRVENAVCAYAIYLWKLIWPVNLAVLYPLTREGPEPWQVLNAALVLVAISLGAWLCRRRSPWLLMGWLWYLGMLVPVIGILQVGHQAYADRYTYLPQIGLCVAITWAVADWAGKRAGRRAVAGFLAGLVLAALTFCAWRQTSSWQNSETLWTSAIAATEDNFVAYNGLGLVRSAQDRHDEAAGYFAKAIQISPDFADGYSNLGRELQSESRIENAIAQYHEAIRLEPRFSQAHYNLGNALFISGHAQEAVAEFGEAARLNPDDADAHSNLGVALAQQGRYEEAITEFEQAVEESPSLADAQGNLGAALLKQGRSDEALAHISKAVDLQPDNLQLIARLAWTMATTNNPSAAIASASLSMSRRVIQAGRSNDPGALRILAAADAQNRDFTDAILLANQALELSRNSNPILAGQISQELKIYRSGKSLGDEN